MDMHMIGDMSTFGLGYTFYDDVHATEITLYLNGTNILVFTSEGKHRTTRSDLDELAEWMREFIANMQDEPYPVQASGEYAAAKDEAAREFDTDDEGEFDRYYDLIDEWVWRHTWHHASSGAILANVYFQQIGDRVEISWNNAGYRRDSVQGASPRKVVFTPAGLGLLCQRDHFFHVGPPP